MNNIGQKYIPKNVTAHQGFRHWECDKYVARDFSSSGESPVV